MNMKSSPAINIKLIQGLNLISQKEYREFVFFSTSRYFSGQRNYAAILKLLQAMHKTQFRGHDNKSILGKLMSELKLNKKTLLSRLSELYKIFEMFVVIRKLKYMPVERNTILMNYYSEKNSFKLFDYVYNSSFETLKKEKISFSKLKNEIQLYDLSSTKNFMQGNGKLYREHFSIKTDFQIFGFLHDILKNSTEIQQQKFMGSEQNTTLPEIILKKLPVKEILESMKKIYPDYYKYTSIIYQMYLSFRNFSDKVNFLKALRLHKEIKKTLSDSDNQFIYVMFITYCINQTHFNKPEFYKYLFTIINEKLRDGYFSELKENNFPVNNFRDYVFIGLRVGETEWVRDFIKNYSSLLPSRYRKDDVLIAESLIALNEQKFEDALSYLSKVKKKNYLHYTDSSFYKLRAFYELCYFDEALNEVDRIRKYLNTNSEIPSIFINKYSSYLKDIEVLIKYSEGKIDKDDFNLYFKESDLITGDNWVSKTVRKLMMLKDPEVQNYINEN